ncbi:MAG: type phosphodiesterase/nucleotide pyrophosphatase [Frankiales bacterium]|nr:type phosphodiesterase/nucleotide pyrophosphatase [Frankiales bacterium]
MPLPSRDHGAAHVSPGADGYLRDRALDVLLDPGLAHVVGLVCWLEKGLVHVADSKGHVALRPDGDCTLLAGRDPIAEQDPMSDSTTCYPFAAVRLCSLFADARAPDLAVVHTGAHCWPERGGHPGEHGSLNGVQSRAPLLLSGRGVAARGVVERVARVVDIGATLAHLAGASYDGMEGSPLGEVVPGAAHVVGLLWDGAQCADLLMMTAAGELPAVTRLLERGCAFGGGAIAEFPSVTLVNHTSALTGVGPGQHGIVNNAFYDRLLGQQVIANSSSTWHSAMQWLRPGVTTVFERLPSGVRSACINDPVDVGATYSTFGLIRDMGAAGNLGPHLPVAAEDPYATQRHVQTDSDYAWSTQVDAAGLDQALSLWREDVPPRLTWWNTTLTDSGHHAGGPGSDIARSSMRDSDRRLGVWLDLVEERGLLDETVVLLTADHGSEAADPSCTGDWDEALRAARVPFRDESYGFLYLGHDVVGPEIAGSDAVS